MWSMDGEIKCVFPLKILANALHATNNLQIIPDFSLKDSRDQTVLGLALWTGKGCRELPASRWTCVTRVEGGEVGGEGLHASWGLG